MYTNIFREIVDILHHDYAGYIDKKGWDNPLEFERIISHLEAKDELNASRFLDIVQDYLIDFQDPHLIFKLIKSDSEKEYDNGFRVRRFQEKLYVTTITTENRINLGDAILSLDNIPVLELVQKHQRELMETKAEREDWRKIIAKYNIAEVIDSHGNITQLELKKYEKASYISNHSMTKIDNNTMLMTLTDFFEPDSIEKLVKENKDVLEKTPNLIIDVRINYGGSTLSYKDLEKYIFPVGETKIDSSTYQMKFNCTARNADLMIQSAEQQLETIESEEYRKGLSQWLDSTWKEHRGKGFVSFDEESSDNDFIVEGLEHPKNIILLADNFCGSTGDIFVYSCKQSPKVTVVGRPTMGINDYSNLVEKRWNDLFELMYPTSRLDSLDHRKPDHEQGIKPHIYIPWTPEHLEKDIDMETAMKLLQEAITK
ncbi:S41 family peptidase [Ornithinibacillus halotolerans]|uniref:Tail specific protease domain-containing protein n=1 Tax=Ornithinibacillus halotolerans TaxID=1274357 RepID=A0A916W723_9BACI|nr:S41 family peptidase [Ornithinibacillus halotolerans]GGA72670.1 hypothetical protein GCM10008025_15570 [Ornithinibacillus halotolerans]